MWSSLPGTSASDIAQEMYSPSSCSNTAYTDTVPSHSPEANFNDVLASSIRLDFDSCVNDNNYTQINK